MELLPNQQIQVEWHSNNSFLFWLFDIDYSLWSASQTSRYRWNGAQIIHFYFGCLIFTIVHGAPPKPADIGGTALKQNLLGKGIIFFPYRVTFLTFIDQTYVKTNNYTGRVLYNS